MLFAVAIVSTRSSEPEVINPYRRTQIPCIYMQRAAVAVFVAPPFCFLLATSQRQQTESS